jgi:acetyltransferase
VWLGGVYVEVMKDVSFRAPDEPQGSDQHDQEIKSYPILLGVRGESKKDMDSLVETIIKVGTIVRNAKTFQTLRSIPDRL